jgi:hypothetical protein
MRIYPNPAQNYATITFEICRTQHVKLSVYSINGQEIATVHDGLLPEGHHQFEWNSTGYPEGIYFVTLKSDERAKVMKMILR